MEIHIGTWHYTLAPLPASPRAAAGASARLAGRPRWPWQAWVCAAVAAGTLLFVGLQVATWVRNIPNWDEFDTVLDFLVRLDGRAEAAKAPGLTELLLAAENEHRTVLSRVLFVAAYWIWGGVNFAAIAVAGNLFLLGAMAILVLAAEGALARLRLAAVLGATVLQLQQHENFFWGGSSIDHFLVVLVVVGTLCALAGRGAGRLAVGCAGGVAATFSLAHGIFAWPAGALLLALDRRWRALAAWGGMAALTLAGYFAGFHFNPGHRLPGLEDLPRVVAQWLTYVGASPSLGNVGLAPWLGAALVAGIAILLGWGGRAKERFWMATAVWCLGALAMIAWGRTLTTDPWAPLTSRYIILSSLAWALVGWVVLERVLQRWPRPALVLVPALVLLLGFNLAANELHSAAGWAFAQKVERAAWDYRREGTFGASSFLIYPDPARADAVIREAEARGLYRLPARADLERAQPQPVKVEEGREIATAAYFLETVEADKLDVTVRGWALRPNHDLRLGDVAVVFRSRDRLVAVEATPILRPDVAREFKRRDATYAGFEVCVARDQLPADKLGIGVCFDLDDAAEFMMTAHTVDNSAH